jgi:hypothetical protein
MNVVTPSAPDAGAPAPARDGSKRITRFSIAGQAATITGDRIELTVPHDTRLRNITPALTFVGAAIAPGPLVPQDFTQPVEYVVTAEDGSTQRYTVRVRVAPNNTKRITHFRVAAIAAEISGDNITLVLPAGSNVAELQPEITLSGGSVSPASDVIQDFSKPVQYTVTGADGATRIYTVVVSLGPDGANDILTFEVPGALTSRRGGEITLTAPFGTSACNWAPVIEHAGARIEPPPGELQDFLRGVVYTVTAADGSERRYHAQCRIPTSSARGIARFELLGLPATIVGDDITVVIPNAESPGSLVPEISHYGERISPASGVAQNFFNPVVYTLREVDGSEHAYTVRVVNADPADNTLVAVMVGERRGRIVGQEVSLTLPAGSDLRALMPTFLHRGARVSPQGVARDFSAAQTYGVIARDGTRREYVVSVRVADGGDKELSEFELLGVRASVEGTSVTVKVPAGSDLRALAPSFLQHTGLAVEPGVEELRDFSRPVEYAVRAADGSVATYVVRVGE